ncbi:hypothetical protein [Saccharicrinis sp. GN24d3]
MDKFTEEEKNIFQEIEKELLPNLPYYTNNPDRNSFNFWQKDKNKHFPNGRLLNRFGKFKLPDDIDTTSLAQMVAGTEYQEALKTKKVLPDHANLHRYRILNGHKQLDRYKAYSTWFGENMPIEFDVCVLSNYLLWVNHFGFELNKNDQDCIGLLCETVENALYFKSGFKSAPEYPKTEVILYHLARTASNTPFLHKVKPKLTEDIQTVYLKTWHPFGQMLLQSSLLKLGVKRDTKTRIFSKYVEDYWWFTAGLLSVYSNPLIQRIASNSLFHFRFVCPAFNYALILENQILNKAF